jgi:hypothetical protein
VAGVAEKGVGTVDGAGIVEGGDALPLRIQLEVARAGGIPAVLSRACRAVGIGKGLSNGEWDDR